MENKFKIGDIIIGKKEASGRYGITKKGWKGKIVEIITKDAVVAEGTVGSGSGKYTISSEYFDLYQSSTPELKPGQKVRVQPGDGYEGFEGHFICLRPDDNNKAWLEISGTLHPGFGSKESEWGSDSKKYGKIYREFHGGFRFQDFRTIFVRTSCLKIIPESNQQTNQPVNQSINKTNMSTLTEKFVQAITGEPNKTFRKAGIINGDNILTQEGLLVLGTWLLNKNAKEFKEEIADGIVAEDEKKNCC